MSTCRAYQEGQANDPGNLNEKVSNGKQSTLVRPRRCLSVKAFAVARDEARVHQQITHTQEAAAENDDTWTPQVQAQVQQLANLAER